MGCFSCSNDTPHFDAYVEEQRQKNTEIKVDAPGNSTTCKVLTYGIAFFSLGTAVIGCVFIVTGTIPAAGAYALLGGGGFVFILDAAAICLARRSYQKAIQELDASLKENGPHSEHTLFKNYHIQRSYWIGKDGTHHVLHFSKKITDAEEIALEELEEDEDEKLSYSEVKRISELIRQPIEPRQIKTFADGIPLIDFTDGDVTILPHYYPHSNGIDRIKGEDEIFINDRRVLFSTDATYRRDFKKEHGIDFVLIQPHEDNSNLYHIYVYTTEGKYVDHLVDTNQFIELIIIGSQTSPEHVYVSEDALPSNFDSLKSGSKLNHPSKRDVYLVKR